MKLVKIFIAFIIVFSGLTSKSSFAQSNHGIVYADTNNLFVIKVQGTHEERGFAQGELLANRISDIMQNYVKPQFGTTTYYNQIKSVVKAGSLFNYDSLIVVEAKALINGMNSVNGNPQNLDYGDILLANSILDIKSILQAKGGVECSSLMSWGNATAGSSLGGKSVISRHLDWLLNPVLTRNQVMVIHLPSENDEQPWAEIGFAGMISVLSGFNENMAVFQHMMSDDIHHGTISGNYTPIWLTLRKSIEKIDPNQDGRNNVSDVKYYLRQQSQKCADGYIISALARSTEPHDSLIAMVAEIASVTPLVTFRSNDYPDSIPGDNLYTANNQIARSNSMHFCSRYNNIRNHIGSGTSIGVDDNRNLMKNYSYLVTNYQFMTFAPEIDLFRVSIRDNQPAYLSPEVDYSVSDLFSTILSISQNFNTNETFSVFPNPSESTIRVNIDSKDFDCQIISSNGEIVYRKHLYSNIIDIKRLATGFYIIKIQDGKIIKHSSFIKK